MSNPTEYVPIKPEQDASENNVAIKREQDALAALEDAVQQLTFSGYDEVEVVELTTKTTIKDKSCWNLTRILAYSIRVTKIQRRMDRFLGKDGVLAHMNLVCWMNHNPGTRKGSRNRQFECSSNVNPAIRIYNSTTIGRYNSLIR